MISELQQRVSGDQVGIAWTLVTMMYEEHPQLLMDEDKFYIELAKLTLKAWKARKSEFEAHGEDVPDFIAVLKGWWAMYNLRRRR